jgi:hypothetical protein
MSGKDGFREVLRSAFVGDAWLKLIALATALGIYIFIHGADNAHRTMGLSVVSILPADSAHRQLMTTLPTEVVVTLRGSRSQLDDLRNDDLGSIQLDLHTGRESRITLDDSMIRVPPGVSVLDFTPKDIDLRWDNVVVREIPVQTSRTGELVAGHTAKSIAVEPRAVRARGPQSIVEVLQFARAAPFDITGLSEGVYRRPLALDRPPKLVTYDTDTVIATLQIEPEIVARAFSRLRVEVVGMPRAIVQPATVTVKVWGIAEEVNALLPEAIIPRVEPKLVAGLDTSQPGSVMLEVLVDTEHHGEAHPPKIEVSPPKVLVRW